MAIKYSKLKKKNTPIKHIWKWIQSPISRSNDWQNTVVFWMGCIKYAHHYVNRGRWKTEYHIWLFKNLPTNFMAPVTCVEKVLFLFFLQLCTELCQIYPQNGTAEASHMEPAPPDRSPSSPPHRFLCGQEFIPKAVDRSTSYHSNSFECSF